MRTAPGMNHSTLTTADLPPRRPRFQSNALTELVIHRVFTICPDRCSFGFLPKLSIRTSGEVPDIQSVFRIETAPRAVLQITKSGSGREGQCTSGITARYPFTIRRAAAGRPPRLTESAFCPPTRRRCRSRTARHPGSASANTERSTTVGRTSSPSPRRSGLASGNLPRDCWALPGGVRTSPDPGDSSRP